MLPYKIINSLFIDSVNILPDIEINDVCDSEDKIGEINDLSVLKNKTILDIDCGYNIYIHNNGFDIIIPNSPERIDKLVTSYNGNLPKIGESCKDNKGVLISFYEQGYMEYIKDDIVEYTFDIFNSIDITKN